MKNNKNQEEKDMSKNAAAEPTVKQIILKDFTRKPFDPPISGILLADGSVICGTTGTIFWFSCGR